MKIARMREHTKNEWCTEWKEGTGMNADLEWGLFALCERSVSRQPTEPIEPSDPRDQRELIDDPLAIHRLLTGALTIFKYTDYRGTHFSYSYSVEDFKVRRIERSTRCKTLKTWCALSVESTKSRKRERESKQSCVERVTGVLSTGCPARSEPLHPLDRPQTVNRLLAAALSTCSAALLLCSPSLPLEHSHTQIHRYTDTHVEGMSWIINECSSEPWGVEKWDRC